MWQALIPVVGNLLDKLLPDPQQAADAKLRMMELAQKGELAVLEADKSIALAQTEVNKVEAASSDLFRGGWRPAAGWACVAGLVYQFLLQPVLPWAAGLFGASVPPLPPIDGESLMALLMGMLGLGGFRSWERIKGRV